MTEPHALDCTANEFIRCPYCSWRFEPDEGYYYDGDRFTEMDCGKCEMRFAVQVEHTTTWTTSKCPVEESA